MSRPNLTRWLRRGPKCISLLPARQYSHQAQQLQDHRAQDSLWEDLSQPTWSIRSLLPSPSNAAADADTPTIIPSQLRHLLRLSALLPPSDPEEVASMIATLQSQLHFVRAIRQVDTEGVEPLRSIRDETEAGLKEATIGIEQLKAALDAEEARGHCRRPRRKRDIPADISGVENWDALAMASHKAGRYFVVKSAKGVEDAS